MDHCLQSRPYVNVVIAGKHPAPQWLTMDAAVKRCSQGIGIWQWASNDLAVAPDVVMALLRRRAYAGDARRRLDPARASASAENPAGQRR